MDRVLGDVQIGKNEGARPRGPFGLTGIAAALYYCVAKAGGRIHASGVSSILFHFIPRMLDPSAVAGNEEEIHR